MAAFVAVCVDKGAPVVLARKRVHLVETFTYEFRSRITRPEKMLLGRPRQFISRCKLGAAAGFTRQRGLASRTQEQGRNSRDAGWCLLLADASRAGQNSGSHALIHTADGELFREALLHASDRGSCDDFKSKKELLERAGEALRLKPAVSWVASPNWPASWFPWSQDEKFRNACRLGYPWFRSPRRLGAK